MDGCLVRKLPRQVDNSEVETFCPIRTGARGTGRCIHPTSSSPGKVVEQKVPLNLTDPSIRSRCGFGQPT